MFAPSHISLHQHRLIFWQPGMFLNRKDDDVTYSSGSLEIKGLRYTGATNSAAEHFQYGLRSGTILKHLIAVPDELLMVGFNFEHKDKRWQGCRDFMYYICFCSHHNDANYELLSTQYHYNLVLRGIILDPEASFYEHVGFVYIKGSAPIRRAVEYGVFERYTRIHHVKMPYDQAHVEKFKPSVDTRPWQEVVAAAQGTAVARVQSTSISMPSAER